MLQMQVIQDVLLQQRAEQKICQLIISQIYQMKKEEFKELMVLLKREESMVLSLLVEQSVIGSIRIRV